ncbi:MAG: MgtC/SapB family protein [Anaerolineae bacterium]|jgi:uncharacterized membrane protein (DUF4010 family)
MANVLNVEPWWRFAAAILIGALIGLEREFVQQREGEPDFAGIRTFSLMALLGAVAAFLTEPYGILPFVVVYAGLALLIWVSYLGDVFQAGREGITTEVAALLVPILGAMVVWDLAELAIALGVITALVLSQKPRLHAIARRMSAEDLWATLEFALIATVVLPLLPNRTFGPLDVLNPYEIWLLVVFVSGIGFLGYILMKVLGAERGIGLTGLLGGLASSTATTLSFAGRSKKTPALSAAFGSAIVLASTMMFPRVLVEVLVVHRPLVGRVILPIGAMLVTGWAVFAVLWQQERSTELSDEGTVDLTNPLNLSTAIKFGLLFAAVLMATKAANRFLGTLGVYAASVITGLTDVDSITLSVSELAATGQLEVRVATVAIILAALTNTIAKGGMALILGSRELRPIVIRAFGAMVLVGVISAAALFWFGRF